MTEHDPKDPQALTTQSTGHGSTLQDWVLVNDPHATPPFEADVTTVRDCVCTPEPHDFEHEPNEPHVPRTQSTGQACILQLCVFVKLGQDTPPLDTLVVMLRDCVCTPDPQVSEHPPNALQLLTMQSTGHDCVAHDCVFVSDVHTAPPFAAAVTTVRD